jgi:hypothetical protein
VNRRASGLILQLSANEAATHALSYDELNRQRCFAKFRPGGKDGRLINRSFRVFWEAFTVMGMPRPIILDVWLMSGSDQCVDILAGIERSIAGVFVFPPEAWRKQSPDVTSVGRRFPLPGVRLEKCPVRTRPPLRKGLSHVEAGRKCLNSSGTIFRPLSFGRGLAGHGLRLQHKSPFP